MTNGFYKNSKTLYVELKKKKQYFFIENNNDTKSYFKRDLTI